MRATKIRGRGGGWSSRLFNSAGRRATARQCRHKNPVPSSAASGRGAAGPIDRPRVASDDAPGVAGGGAGYGADAAPRVVGATVGREPGHGGYG